MSGAVSRNGFAYSPSDYSGLTVVRPILTPGQTVTVPFIVPGFEGNQLSSSFRVTTPTLRFISATASVTRGATPIFREASPGTSTEIDGAIDLRPTPALRNSIQFSRLILDRSRDGSRFSTETIPRIKTEYQVSKGGNPWRERNARAPCVALGALSGAGQFASAA